MTQLLTGPNAQDGWGPPANTAGLPARKDAITVEEAGVTSAICRRSFFEFVKEMWDVLVPEQPVWNWHIKYLCDVFQEAAERVMSEETKPFDYIINVPPGSTKSTIFSIMGPAWVWTRMPHARFICGSFTDPLALDLANKSRTVIQSEKYADYFPEIVLSGDQNTKSHFTNTKRGMRFSVGAGGSVIGRHAHFIIVDDPVDPNSTTSEEEMKTVNRWVTEVLPTRKVNKHVTVTFLIMQRLHQNDPTGAILDSGKEKIYHICLPAEATTDEDAANVKPPEALACYKDGLLDPVRLSRDVLAEALKELLERGYSCQFRQFPIPEGGATFDVKKFVLNQELPDPRYFQRVVRYWDKASTAGGGAFTVGVKMALDKYGRFWVLDVVRVQVNSFKRESLIVSTAKLDGRKVRIGVEQEPGSGGKESAEATVQRLRGFVVTIDKVTGAKEARAEEYSTQVNGGNFYLMPRAGWVAAYIDEHRFFPFSRYKDQVDAGGGAFAMLARPRRRVGGL